MNLLEFLKFKGIRDQMNPPIYGNDLPSQGGYGGNLPRTTGPYSSDTSYDMNQDSDVMPDIQYSMGTPIDPNQPDEEEFNKLRNLPVPNRADFKPSKMRRIGAALAGLGTGSGPAAYYGGVPVGFKGDIEGGIKVQDALKNKDYYEAVGDYEQKLKPLQETARMENTRNINERQIRGQELRDKQFYDKQSETERANRAREDVNQQKVDISKDRAATYKFRTENPEHTIKQDDQGYLIGIDPITNESEQILNDEGNPVKGSTLTEEEKLRINNKNALGQISARGAQSRQTQSEGITARSEANWSQPFETTIDGKTVVVQINNDTGEGRIAKLPSGSNGKLTRPGTEGAGGRNQDPGMFYKAQQIYNQHPEWQPYINLRPGRTFDLAIPKGGNKAILDQINQEIYGVDANNMATHGTGNNQPMKKPIPGHPGKFAVSSDGGRTWKVE